MTNTSIPPEISQLARQVAKSELAECEDPLTRQGAGQVGELVLQAVWNLIQDQLAPKPEPAPAREPISVELPERKTIIFGDWAGGITDAIDHPFDDGPLLVWLTRDGVRLAAVIPAADVHEPGTCCCQHCPWNGNHGNPVR
jgi:hypothetical protein